MKNITGSVIENENIRPFIYDLQTKKITLDEYLQDRNEPMEAFVENNLNDEIRKLLPFRADEIRIGEYFCRDCEKWFEAAGDRWSYGICLSCSLDQGTEMADWNEDDE